MSLLDTLERKLGRLAVPHVTVGLIACQVIAYCVIQGQTRTEGVEPVEMRLYLIPERVLQGEVWRLVSFLVVPPFTNVIFAFFFWYLFYLMGTSLEYFWGTFRFNVYLLIGFLATVGASFLFPNEPASNGYFQASVFLAFAFLNPDFELYLFFILPVKIKWFALLTWIGYGFVLVLGDWATRLLVLASISNFLIFFGKDILDRIKTGRRRMAYQATKFVEKEPAYFHRCLVCGITDRSHPQMEFRYCSKCAGACGYCSDHLRNHEHITDGVPG